MSLYNVYMYTSRVQVSLASVRSCGDNISIGEEWCPAFGVVVYSDFVLGEGGTVLLYVSPLSIFLIVYVGFFS